MAVPYFLQWSSWVSLGIRVGVLGTLVLSWHQVVESLIRLGLIHPMRRMEVRAFRFRFLAIAVLVELFVIQQLPQLLIKNLSV